MGQTWTKQTGLNFKEILNLMELHHSLHLRDQNQVFHQNPEEQKEQVSKNIKVELVKAKLQTVSLFLSFFLNYVV